eukprot:365917-Chlamydomonas_euryale.AAC.8
MSAPGLRARMPVSLVVAAAETKSSVRKNWRAAASPSSVMHTSMLNVGQLPAGTRPAMYLCHWRPSHGSPST